MMNEAAIHHFSLLESLVGSCCKSIYTELWVPEHAKDMLGGSQSLSVLNYENGVRVGYEMTMSSASSLHSWGNEMVRAEMERAVLVLKGNSLHCYWKSEAEKQVNRPGEGVELPLLGTEDDCWGNVNLVGQFVRWLEEDEIMETCLENAARAQILVFAAIESSRQGVLIDCKKLTEEYREVFNRRTEA